MTQRKTLYRGSLIALALILCLSFFIGEGYRAKADEEIVSSYPYTTVTKESVNLRASRSTKAELLKKIPKGAEVSVLSKNGSWVEVEYKNTKGWAVADYIQLKTVKKIKITPTPTPIPTLTPEEDAGGYPILKKGTSGRYVRSLQEAMIELGFLTGKADGNFGDSTERAVIAFQTKNSYPNTGLMDANIQAFLYSGKPKNVRGEATTLKTLSPVPGATMKKNCTGALVGELQQMLKNLGYYTAAITNKYDTDTQTAVKAFQKKNNLKADGVAGAETRTLIESGKGLAADATPTPEPTAVPTPTATPVIPSSTVKSGSKGEDAMNVQSRLKELGYYRGLVDGEFGRASVNALKNFQTNNGLKFDGVAGTTTYNVLYSSAAVPFSVETPTPEPIPTATPAPTSSSFKTLREGMSGSEVKQLQENLIQLGYLTGKPDGKYGADTTAAVKAFQKANRLTADGVAGPTTQKAIYSGTSKAAPTPKPTATPKPDTNTNTSSTAAITGVLRRGSTGSSVSALQQKLIDLGFLRGKADGVYGSKTAEAVKAFQKANKLTADGIAGSRTIAKLTVGSTSNSSSATVTPAPTAAPSVSVTTKPSAGKVIYANWYTTVKAVCKAYPYCTVYDYNTGISWQIHIFSVGAHADFEPVTANDTARMQRAFGGETTWNPKPVWVIFSNGSVYMASVHDTPHGVSHTADNNFAGHACLHFPRTQEQVEKIGPYATSHQETIDKGWAETQKMAR